MPSTALLRIPRADDKDSCILVHATNTSSTQLLEITLTATEGERAFETKLKESELGLYKRKQFSRSLDDLRSITQYVFQKIPSTDSALVEGLDIKADVEDDIITIRIGKHYSGISQQFAAFGIPQRDDAEISIFDWAADSCKALDEVTATNLLLQSSLAAKDATIKSLTTQLSELTDLKKKHEDQLLIKFSELLNSKKAKIRELTQKLESGSLGSNKDTPKEPSPSPPPAISKPTPSTRPSRKRKPALPEPSSDDDDIYNPNPEIQAVEMDIDPTPNPTTKSIPSTRSTRNTRSNGSNGSDRNIQNSSPSLSSSAAAAAPEVLRNTTNTNTNTDTNRNIAVISNIKDDDDDDDDDLPPPRPRIDWETGKLIASGPGAEAASGAGMGMGMGMGMSQVSHVSDTQTFGIRSSGGPGGSGSGSFGDSRDSGRKEGLEDMVIEDSDVTGDETE